MVSLMLLFAYISVRGTAFEHAVKKMQEVVMKLKDEAEWW